MALRKVVLAAFLTIATLWLSVSVSIADECVTVDSYAQELGSEGVKLFGSKADATAKMEALFNQNRARDGKPAIEASVFLVGYVANKDGEIAVIAAIFDKKGCVIGATVGLMSLRQWVAFVTVAGVTAKDFVPLDGA